MLESVVDQQWEEMPSWLRRVEPVPNYDWSIAYHEAGHVVVAAAMGLLAEGAHVCAWPKWHSGGWSRPGTYFAREVRSNRGVVVYVAGATAEGIIEAEMGVKSRWGRRLGTGRGTDGRHVTESAARCGVDRSSWVRLAHRAARDILVANDTTWRAVAAVLHERQWVGGGDLARLTASVKRVAPPERPAANGKPHRRAVAVEGGE